MDEEFTCIICPSSCVIKVRVEEGRVREVSGNLCVKGEEYVKKELLSPERGLTSTVKVAGGVLKLVSVRTSRQIPKDKIMEVMDDISTVEVAAPIGIGDVIVRDVAGTGADIIATRGVDSK